MIGMDIIMERNHSLCELTRVLLPADFLQMLQWQYASLLLNDPEVGGGECPASENYFNNTFLFIRSSESLFIYCDRATSDLGGGGIFNEDHGC
jgi:hypothetical protein